MALNTGRPDWRGFALARGGESGLSGPFELFLVGLVLLVVLVLLIVFSLSRLADERRRRGMAPNTSRPAWRGFARIPLIALILVGVFVLVLVLLYLLALLTNSIG